jgi:hypothetical protein
MRVPPQFQFKQSYTRSLHNSIGHNPFMVCLGFQPLSPIDIAPHVAYSLTDSFHTQTKDYHVARLFEQIQPLQNQAHDILQQTKQDNFFNKARNSPRFRFKKIFPISHGNLTQWGPFLPKGVGMIQVDIGGHPPIPLSQNTIFHLCSFSTIFEVLNFRVIFEALNDIILDQQCLPCSQNDQGGHQWTSTYSTISKYSFHLGNCSTIFKVPNFRGCFEALNNIFLTW